MCRIGRLASSAPTYGFFPQRLGKTEGKWLYMVKVKVKVKVKEMVNGCGLALPHSQNAMVLPVQRAESLCACETNAQHSYDDKPVELPYREVMFKC